MAASYRLDRSSDRWTARTRLRCSPFAAWCWCLLFAAIARADAAAQPDPFESYDPFDEVCAVAPADRPDQPAATCESEPTAAECATLCLHAAEPAAFDAPDDDSDPDAPEARIPITPLCDLTTNITLPSGLLPRDYSRERPLFVPESFDPTATTRFWPVTPLNWVASCLTHNPLYFEEINVERYGYACGAYGPCCTTCIQSLASGAHFFATVPALPYMMATDCPTDCIYTLGNYRPGSCPPWRPTCNTRPSWAGGLATAGVATGIIFLIP